MKTMNTFKLVFLCGTLVTSSGYNTADGGRILNDLCKAKCYLKVRFSIVVFMLFVSDVGSNVLFFWDIYCLLGFFFLYFLFRGLKGGGVGREWGMHFCIFFLNFYFDSDSFICCCIFCLLLLFMFWFNICNL